jgi:hypothetical protein
MLDTDAIKAQLGTITSTRLPPDWDAKEFERWCVDNLRALIAEVEQLRTENAQACDSCQGLWRAMAEKQIGELRTEAERLRGDLALEMHKVIACGVAARNPDANLSRTGVYATEWDSPQAADVRALRDDRDRLRAILAKLRDADVMQAEREVDNA